ncbi:helicase associated domain-containing protein [Ruegeria sp. THAF33]
MYAWVQTQRQYAKSNKLSSEQYDRLDALTGWFWGRTLKTTAIDE